MIPQQQLASPQHLGISQTFLPSASSVSAGLLGNQLGQTPSLEAIGEGLWDSYYRLRHASHPDLKLARIKQEKFTLDGRERRIGLSLAALNAKQPTELSVAEWREIVEEVEEDED